MKPEKVANWFATVIAAVIATGIVGFVGILIYGGLKALWGWVV